MISAPVPASAAFAERFPRLHRAQATIFNFSPRGFPLLIRIGNGFEQRRHFGARRFQIVFQPQIGGDWARRTRRLLCGSHSAG